MSANVKYFLPAAEQGKSCNKAKHLHIAPPYFRDLEYSMAVSLLYSRLQIFPYKRMEKKWQVGVLSLTALLKALVHD
jgi:hypothetical protein